MLINFCRPQLDNVDVPSLRESDLQKAQTSSSLAHGVVVESSFGCREESLAR